MSYVIGVDSGGTFTDCVVLDSQGRITRAKAPSTPPDFERGVVDAVAKAAHNLDLPLEELLAETTIFGHGTTVATNILITGTGAKAALLTTRGHEDAVIIGRSSQKVAGLSESEIIDVAHLTKAEPLVPRSFIFGVDERVDRTGTVVAPLHLERLEGLVDHLQSEGVEAIAISLLWSFRNPDHERQIRDWLRQCAADGGRATPWFVTTSSDLVPVIREYERTSTTMLNAYLTPGVKGYLERMRCRLHENGHQGAITIMQSAGGVSSIDEARDRGVALLASGPAGGILGARALAERLGISHVIATDVGGTSFDVGLIVEGEPSYAEAPIFHKYPVALPVIDVTSVGAGGGSIAWIEPDTRILKVGPRSAGASPGPACYGAGGWEPTVTDANLVLGRLDADNFLGGRLRLETAQARRAIRDQIADPLSMSVEAAAMTVVDIVDAHMADLVRRVTVERGLDPAQFTVFGYGGAAGLHVTSYAPRLNCRHIVIPRTAAVFSAVGIAMSDVKRVAMKSDPMRAPFELSAWSKRFAELRRQLDRQFRDERLPGDRLAAQRFVELQFRGQVHALRVPIEDADLEADDGGKRVIARFIQLYEARYGTGTAYPAAGVEAVTFVIEGVAPLPVPAIQPLPRDGSEVQAALRGTRGVYLHQADSASAVPVYDAGKLQPGHEFDGPALVEDEDTTVLIRFGQRLWVDDFGNLRIVTQ